jgi:hypothetical protein
MNTKGTTLKETTQRRMSEIAQRTVHFTGKVLQFKYIGGATA